MKKAPSKSTLRKKADIEAGLMKSLGYKPRKGKVVYCKICGKAIYRKPNEIKKNRNHYCSKECQHKGIEKGAKIKLVCENCGIDYTTYISQKIHRNSRFCSNKCKYEYFHKIAEDRYKKTNKQDKRSIYKRIRVSNDYINWRKEVFERDNYTCQKYNLTCIYIEPHHIKNFTEYPELRLDVNNGITLSRKAHLEFHKKYGFKNNNEDQIKEFLNEEKKRTV